MLLRFSMSPTHNKQYENFYCCQMIPFCKFCLMRLICRRPTENSKLADPATCSSDSLRTGQVSRDIWESTPWYVANKTQSTQITGRSNANVSTHNKSINPTLPARQATGLFLKFIRKMLKLHKFHPCKMQILQEIGVDDSQQKNSFLWNYDN